MPLASRVSRSSPDKTCAPCFLLGDIGNGIIVEQGIEIMEFSAGHTVVRHTISGDAPTKVSLEDIHTDAQVGSQ